MRRILLKIMRFLCALGLGLASLAAQAEPGPADDGPSRQLLVMLSLPKSHYRPDSSYAGAYGDGLGQQARQRSAAALAKKYGLELASEWSMPLAGVDCFVMHLPPADARASEQLAQQLSSEGEVAWAQAMHVYRTLATHQDPLYAAQPAAGQWRLADLHELATGRGVKVAVIDSGIDAAHPDLAGALLSNENFVDEGRPLPAERHGTAVAGIIAARADNGIGIAGVAPQARLLGLRACRQTGRGDEDTVCTSLSLAKALSAAVRQGAQIINMSLAGPDDRLLALLVDQALARGVAVVAALGSGLEGERFPAHHPGVIAVSDRPLAAPLPAGVVMAPGRDVPSTAPDGNWALVSGSSFATAHVSGLLALMQELGSEGKASGAVLLRAALVSGPAGRIDACASLLRQVAPRRCACAQAVAAE